MRSPKRRRRAGFGTSPVPLRIGVASILQETNTWSPVPCTLDDFICQGLAVGHEADKRFADTNTEFGGALRAVREAGCLAIPLVRAWANSSGRLTAETLNSLCQLLAKELSFTEMDGLVLSLHGAMAAEAIDDADAAVLEAARKTLGSAFPIGVCLDMHANVSGALIDSSYFVIGYHTYPHIDMGKTGARAARLLIASLRGELNPVTALAKRPMLIPAEAMSTSESPLADLRRMADQATTGPVVDVSIFPVQPWLDIEELGLGVTVTTDRDPGLASELAESFARKTWERRDDFTVQLLAPADAVRAARTSKVRPFLISESADAPTAGATGDSPAMVRALLEHGPDLQAYVTITDPPAVDRCFVAGVGNDVLLRVGAFFDGRFHEPVELSGSVANLGDKPVRITGPSYTGMEVSMGRFAVVQSGRLAVLITERPAFTLDPATFVQAGLDPARADVIVVRSANGFRAAYPQESVAASVWLDLPGASTPRLDLLEFSRAPRPLYPLDPDPDFLVIRA